MRRFLIGFFMVLLGSFACDKINTDEPVESTDLNYGVALVTFNYWISGVPYNRVKRINLALAYSADSLYRGEYFTAANVSDSVSQYRFLLKPGAYFYYASIICLCGGDSCKYAGFDGQYGTRADGGKFEVSKDQVTKVSVQLH